MPVLIDFEGKKPRVAPSALIAETAVLIGDVEIAAGASVWFGAVLRADFAPIRIGSKSNIQDNVVIHTDVGDGLTIEEGVTVGHGAILHGTRICRGCLIGMGAILLSGSTVGANTLIAAGSVVRQGQIIPPNSLVAGNPATVKKSLDGPAAVWAKTAADEYSALALRYTARQFLLAP